MVLFILDLIFLFSGVIILTRFGYIPNKELTNDLPPACCSAHSVSKIVSPRLAYFVGYFYGDGGLKDIEKTLIKHGRREYKMIISDEFLSQIKKIQILFFELFGISPPIRFERILKGERTYYLNPTNKRVYTFLTKTFGLPSGPKNAELEIPKIIIDSSTPIRKWFVRGLFDADGDTRAVEKGFTSQSRVKLRMTAHKIIAKCKLLLEKDFSVSVNGPYLDKGGKSSYIQIERFADIKLLNQQKLFLHPIKRWRLAVSSNNLVSSHTACNHL